MTDEIEIPDPLGEENETKKTKEAPVEPPADATVINLPPAAPEEEPAPVQAAPVVEAPALVPTEPVAEEPVRFAEPEVVVMPDMGEIPSPVIETPVEVQAAAAPPPSYASPAAPTKKDNTIWWILGVALLLILCCCCIGIMLVLWFSGDFIIEALNSISAIAMPLLLG